MKNQELDDLLRRKLTVSSKVPEGIWDKIDQTLSDQDLQSSPTILPFWSKHKKTILYAAASVALLVTAGTFYIYNENTLIQEEGLAHTIAPTNTVTNTPIQPAQSTTNNQVTVSNTNTINNYSTQSQGSVSHQYNDPTNLHIENNSKDLNVEHTIETKNTTTIAYITPIQSGLKWEKLPTYYQPVLKNAKTVAVQSLVNNNEPIPLAPQYIGLKDRMIPEDWNPTSTPSRNAIARSNTYNQNDVVLGVSGGYNYGSLQSGGSVAVNTRKQLSKKVFIDGSIGMVMNNSSNEQSNFKGDFIAFKKDFAQKLSTNNMDNLYSNSSPFYFVQINPTVGFNVAKNFDVSFGPDYQQMVSNSDHDVINLADQSKILPKYDFGVTGKAELNINKNIKAGFVLREGLTSIIKNNSSISDRRYLQIQLKYQLPYKKD